MKFSNRDGGRQGGHPGHDVFAALMTACHVTRLYSQSDWGKLKESVIGAVLGWPGTAAQSRREDQHH